MKRTVRLTEKDLHNIVLNILRESEGEFQASVYDEAAEMFYSGIRNAVNALNMISNGENNPKLKDIANRLSAIADETHGLI